LLIHWHYSPYFCQFFLHTSSLRTWSVPDWLVR